MKIRRVSIKNFKMFREKIEIDFSNKITNQISDRYMILGDNGSGKTTVLQAIALVLSLAQGSIQRVDQFRWSGWNANRFLKWGEPEIEVDVEFTDDEILATKEAAEYWIHIIQNDLINKYYQHYAKSVSVFSSKREIRLNFNGLSLEPSNDNGLFLGRYFISKSLEKVNNTMISNLYSRLPYLFYFDQNRNNLLINNSEEIIENKLKQWHSLQRDHVTDHLSRLQAIYQRIFPGRTFAGIEAIYSGGPAPSGTLFVLSDGQRTYGLSEMSAGEQSVFPVAFDFVERGINNAVVLIDELDLNLHPPLAQRLLRSLPLLGEDNQFIFTTHSSAVADLVSPHTIHRLPGGRLCL